MERTILDPESSRSQSIQHSWEWNGFPHMFQAADPGDGALNSHSEPGMGKGSILAKIQIPVKCLGRQMVFLNPLIQQFQTRSALAATNDLSIALWGEHVNAQG